MAVNVKMGVDIAGFKQGMADAQASVKTLDAALKANEKQMKLTGAAEDMLAQRTNLLNQKLETQKKIAKTAEQALREMEKNGVQASSKAYQDMQRRMIEAHSAMLDVQIELQGVGDEAADAADKTDKLAESLGGLNKKVSLDQVIRGIDSITNGMEKAAKKAIELGNLIWQNITDSAKWADDTATQAMMLDMDVEDYQKMQKVFDTVAEMTVQDWMKAKQKVQKAIHDPSDETENILSLLGIETWTYSAGKYGMARNEAKAFEDVFWEIGDVLKQKIEDGELTQDLADTYAQAIFGKSYASLKPMFALGREGFEAALEEQNVVTEESVNKLAELNDELTKLKGDFETLKTEVLAGLAPALQRGAEALDGLLTRLIEYLHTPEGQQALENMGNAVSGLFEDLGKIDPQQVVEGFTSVFNTIVDGLKWLDENKQTVVDALKFIVMGWSGLKLTGGALQVLRLINGAKTLFGGNGTPTGAQDVSKAVDPTPRGAPVTNTGSAASGGIISRALNGAAQIVGKSAYGLAMFDPSGATALLPQVLADRTEFGYQLAHGASVGEAAGASWETIKASATEGINNFTNYFTQDAPNAFWKIFGFKDAQDAAAQASAAMEKAGAGLQAADGWVLGDDVTADEAMQRILSGNPEPVEIPVEVETEEDAAASIVEQVGTVRIPATLVVTETENNEGQGSSGGHGFANGLPYVPFDNFLARLHKGERIVPAREVGSSRNFSSNLYVESMYMNNGQDAEGLASAMAAANRRTMSGFGS